MNDAQSAAEQEAIGLCIALEALDDIVNHALLDLVEVKSRPGEFEVRAKDNVHQQMFLLRLLDFVKEKGDSQLTGVKGSCLDVISAACDTHAFGTGSGLNQLQEATAVFHTWINEETTFRMWIPTLDVDARLTMPRIDFLYIIGNHVKHNLSRLTGVSKTVHQILAAHDYNVPIERVPLALDDMREHLEEDFFVYYSTWLVELLNNMRWGIQEYLTDVFARSYKVLPGGEGRYEYIFPDAVQADIPRTWFWRLMNYRRSHPPFARFKAAEYLKDALIYADR